MIICIWENSASWDEYAKPYLLNTEKLTNQKLKSILETASNDDILFSYDELKGLTCDKENNWLPKIKEDVQQSIVYPPQTVNKLLTIGFEGY